MTKYGVWFGGGEDGAPDWLRNQVGDVFMFDTLEKAQMMRHILYADQEKIEVRRVSEDGGTTERDTRIDEQG